MFEEREAIVTALRPYDVHGVPHVEVTLVFPDRSVETARLGAESVTAGIAEGDRVSVRMVMRTVVEVRVP